MALVRSSLPEHGLEKQAERINELAKHNLTRQRCVDVVPGWLDMDGANRSLSAV